METIKPIDPLLAAALDPRAFEPKTWHASCFGVNDSGQTILLGPYDKDELIQEAERRGAINILRELRTYLVGERQRLSKGIHIEDFDDGWKFSLGFNVTFAALDTFLSYVRAHEHEEPQVAERF